MLYRPELDEGNVITACPRNFTFPKALMPGKGVGQGDIFSLSPLKVLQREGGMTHCSLALPEPPRSREEGPASGVVGLRLQPT